MRRKTTAYEKRIVASNGRWKCSSCGELLDETYEIDHVVPLSVGGEDDISNLSALHASCHRKKTIREEMERIEKRREERRSSKFPPLSCTRCGRVVSPFFLHKCVR